MTQATALKQTADSFPGLADLVPCGAPEPVQARLWDGSQVEGELAGFLADE